MKIEEISNKQQWEDFVLKNPDGNFLHSWNWGEFQKNLGRNVYRLGFFQKNLEGLALLYKEEAKRGVYLSCVGGPLIDWDKKEFFVSFVKLVKDIGKKEDVVFIRVRPQILDTPSSRELFKEQGLTPAPMHMHAETTWQLDLSKSENEIMSGMRKNTRYEIRKAERLGVTVEQSKNLEDVDFLYKLQIEIAKRHKFVPFSQRFLKEQFKAFLVDDQVILFKAFYPPPQKATGVRSVDDAVEGTPRSSSERSGVQQPVAIAFIIFYGLEAVYHYAASSEQARKCSASYAIQWQAIQEAKRRGLKRYNFWGISPSDDPKHRFWGVTIFKKGFGGFPVSYLHAHDLPLKTTYWVAHLFEKARKKIRRL